MRAPQTRAKISSRQMRNQVNIKSNQVIVEITFPAFILARRASNLKNSYRPGRKVTLQQTSAIYSQYLSADGASKNA